MHEALARANFDRDVARLKGIVERNASWEIVSSDFPTIDVILTHTSPVRFTMQCDDWDEIPPSVRILRPDGAEWLKGLQHPYFHQDVHPATGRTFICMPGVREYHTHTSHVSDSWANYKGTDGMNLPGILLRIGGAWRKAPGA